MEHKKTISFPLVIIAIIIGVALFRQFDSTTLRFDNPWLSVVYGVTFSVLMYALIRNNRGANRQ